MASGNDVSTIFEVRKNSLFWTQKQVWNQAMSQTRLVPQSTQSLGTPAFPCCWFSLLAWHRCLECIETQMLSRLGFACYWVYLLGLLAKIKCSICSYQLNLWYSISLMGVLNAKLAWWVLALELHYFLGCSPPFNQSKNKLRRQIQRQIDYWVVHVSLEGI